MNIPPRLRSNVWLLMGLTGSTPGVLNLSGGRLSLTVQDAGVLSQGQLRMLEGRTQQPGLAERLTRGQPRQLFSRPLAEIERVTFPWYYFGGGMVITVDGVGYRISFVQPQNTAVGVTNLSEGIREGKVWKATLRDR
jgi:hypothetical protein